MSQEEEESFTITWRIKNFSMATEELSNHIESPVVRVRQFGNSEWSLILYPKGCKLRGFISCYLRCVHLEVYETLKVEYNLSVITQSFFKNTTEKDFKVNGNWGYNKWVPMEDIKKEKEKYLPKDTFTIICSMKCKKSCDLKNIEDEIFEALSRECKSGKQSLNINKCFIETIIPVQKKRFLWPIQKFLHLSKNKRITLPMLSAIKGTPSFYVTVIKSAESPLNIEIKRKDEKSKTIFVRCTVSVVNAPKDIKYSSEDEFLFKSEGDVWIFSPLLDWSKLEDEYLRLNGGVLYLQFDFAVSFRGQLHHNEKQDWRCLFLPIQSEFPLEVFTPSNTDEDLRVVELRAGDRTFTVHLALLKAKSGVFRAMFNTDMKEKETGVVDILDVEPETLGRMLLFFYSGSTVSDLSTTEVKSLYAAAHKYKVQPLMDNCSSNLKSCLTVTNVCDILQFADLYRDDWLLKTAEDFITGDSDRVLVSQDWKNFMENNLSLAANVMYKMLLK